jgi:ribosome-binding protein aMBF1 (putative translation factor)
MIKNSIYEKIGERVKGAHEISGITQADFADKNGEAVTYISSIERGVSFPRGYSP